LIAIIDNYDSFTYNLVQYFGELGARVQVFRNDTISAGQLQALEPSHIVISPGPGDPSEAGISNQVIRELGPYTPLLGVCLGHQCIGEVFGGRVVGAGRLMHGKTSQVHHYGEGLFSGIPSPFEATRYHSLIVTDPDPAKLVVTAFTTRREVMAVRHRRYPIYGVQFHPEAILTQYGKQILKNFLLIQPAGRATVPVQVKGESHA
jgi:anthranilate synthase component 2